MCSHREKLHSPIQRWALELLRNPVVLLPEGAEMAYEALSVDLSRTVRSSLGAIRRDLANDLITPTAAARGSWRSRIPSVYAKQNPPNP